MKKIIDSVHGTIFVDSKFFEHIIDTELFQRLRRIEQSSIRSIFPSARHDRFAHSLGVFHMGVMIDRQIRRDNKNHNSSWFNLVEGNKDRSEQIYKQISHSYLVACLLHDIAHAPFSHTFEKYYGSREYLCDLLSRQLPETYRHDIDKIDDINYHEYASGCVALSEYSGAMDKLGVNPELVVRMITGVQYEDKSTRYNQIANGFISLLHGDVIDADRLDYACRDVWASGYATCSIDAARLISGIHFRLINTRYEICFKSNVLNEIESVITVKDFQVKNVLHHHTVEYEQELLKQAAEEMAWHIFPESLSGEKALENIISLDAVVRGISLPPDGKLTIKHITDDDLVFLIKNDSANTYYNEWASRQYKKYALWKNREEFFAYFGDIVPWGSDVTEDFIRPIIEQVIAEYGYDTKTDLKIVKTKFKDRVKLNKLNVYIGGKVVQYSKLYNNKYSLGKGDSDEPVETIFCYVFLQKDKNKPYRSKEFFSEKTKIINRIKEVMKNPEIEVEQKEQYIEQP